LADVEAANIEIFFILHNREVIEERIATCSVAIINSMLLEAQTEIKIFASLSAVLVAVVVLSYGLLIVPLLKKIKNERVEIFNLLLLLPRSLLNDFAHRKYAIINEDESLGSDSDSDLDEEKMDSSSTRSAASERRGIPLQPILTPSDSISNRNPGTSVILSIGPKISVSDSDTVPDATRKGNDKPVLMNRNVKVSYALSIKPFISRRYF
jgi:hypothetical protein